jgi:hypothetical protein
MISGSWFVGFGMPGLPLSQAINEYLAWLELDRHALTHPEHRRPGP